MPLLLLFACGTDDGGQDAARPGPSIHALMAAELAPASDAIWQGVVENYEGDKVVIATPQDEAGWKALAQEAERLEAAARSLAAPGIVVAAPGETIQDAGNPDAPQVEAIAGRISRDEAGFAEEAQRMGDVARRLRAAIVARNAAQVIELGNALNEACSNCHERYWYSHAS